MLKFQKLARKLGADRAWEKLYLSRARRSVLREDYILGDRYTRKMLKRFDGSASSFSERIDDAERQTANFHYRHHRVNRLLGCWRWKGLWQKRALLAPIVFDGSLRGLDFGGANGPVSLHTCIVDFDTRDTFGRAVNIHSLDDLTGPFDYLFTSHTLEHIENLDQVLTRMQGLLKPAAALFLHLPAFTCTRWRPGIHRHQRFNDHHWAFALSSDTGAVPALDRLILIDRALSHYFDVHSAEYVGDNSIFIHASTRTRTDTLGAGLGAVKAH